MRSTSAILFREFRRPTCSSRLGRAAAADRPRPFLFIFLQNSLFTKFGANAGAAAAASTPCSLSRISGCRDRGLYPLARPRAERHPLPAPIPFREMDGARAVAATAVAELPGGRRSPGLLRAAAGGRAFFLGVPSMNDSLEVEVLYRRVRLRRNPGLEGNNSEPGGLDRTTLSGSGPGRLLLRQVPYQKARRRPPTWCLSCHSGS